jgi:hypothetical protein
MASIQVQGQPSAIYRQAPWLAERTLRREPAERLRRSIRNNRNNVLLNSFFAVFNVATGKAVFLVMMVPAIAHGAHKWHKLQKDPTAFHEKDRSLRQLVDDYRAKAEAGAWQGIPAVPLRLLVAPVVALPLVAAVWLIGHPGAVVSLSAGLAGGALWAVGALLSMVLGIGTDDPAFAAA